MVCWPSGRLIVADVAPFALNTHRMYPVSPPRAVWSTPLVKPCPAYFTVVAAVAEAAAVLAGAALAGAAARASGTTTAVAASAPMSVFFMSCPSGSIGERKSPHRPFIEETLEKGRVTPFGCEVHHGEVRPGGANRHAALPLGGAAGPVGVTD